MMKKDETATITYFEKKISIFFKICLKNPSMCCYAGIPPVQQDTEVTDGGCHLYSDRVFMSTLHDHFVPSQGNTDIVLCDSPQ